MTCILLLIWHVSSSSYDMYPAPQHTNKESWGGLRFDNFTRSQHIPDMYPPPPPSSPEVRQFHEVWAYPWQKEKFCKVSALVYLLYKVSVKKMTFQNLCPAASRCSRRVIPRKSEKKENLTRHSPSTFTMGTHYIEERQVSKEAYYSVKRDLLQCQKRHSLYREGLLRMCCRAPICRLVAERAVHNIVLLLLLQVPPVLVATLCVLCNIIIV